MPLKVDKMRLGLEYDRRIKLDPSHHSTIRQKHASGMAIRALARLYGVDRGLIKRIVDIEYANRQKALYKERRKDGRYYNKDKHRGSIQKLREYKKSLQKDNKLYPPYPPQA